MERWLGKYSEFCYAFMRMVVGFLFACHGAQKLFGMFAAGVIEFLAGCLVALGLWAGYAAFIASGQMAVAYFVVHAPDGFWPIVNKGELAALYCFVFLYVATRGSGRLSIDALVKNRRT